jgi:hypothetical protein
MLSRVVLLLVSLFVAASLACNDDSVRLAQGSALQGKTPNDHPIDVTGDGGTSSGGGEGGGACTKPGPPAAGCPSFATLWTKYFSPGAEWGCGKAGCHNLGGNSPQPLIEQQATYTALAAYVIKGVPYVNPKCTEPEQSSIICNITGKPSQCSLQGSMPQSITPSAASLADLQKWVSCGSPP